ncbi:MAG: YqiJ family protein [Bacteroidia bacterium]|nr:YqiJ family protein [Bacteroidia bacterium]
MSLWQVINEPIQWIFIFPMLVALGYWLFSWVGLTDLHYDSSDLHSTPFESYSGILDHFAHFIGLGMVPGSILCTLILFCFGCIGFLINWLSVSVGFTGGLFWGVCFLSILVSITVSILVTPGIARLLNPFFQNREKTIKSRAIIGKVAVLQTETLTETFGMAIVKLDSGKVVNISVRSLNPQFTFRYGDKLVLTDYNENTNVYFVERLTQTQKQN